MEKQRKITIAIDGPAASGKSTTARIVARELGYLHIDTGAMYRAVTLWVLQHGIPVEDESRIDGILEMIKIHLEPRSEGNRVFLNEIEVTDAIRTLDVTSNVSAVSSYSRVREVMVLEQRRIAANGGVVLDGRDIGTIVLPKADLKIFMIANVVERAHRRMIELEGSGIHIDQNKLEVDLIERDRKDSTRVVSPLKKAGDAIELDTTNLSITEQVGFVLLKARELIEGKGI
ncbi:MAG: (d)CMP kinase [bacterium]